MLVKSYVRPESWVLYYSVIVKHNHVYVSVFIIGPVFQLHSLCKPGRKTKGEVLVVMPPSFRICSDQSLNTAFGMSLNLSNKGSVSVALPIKVW